MSQIEERNFRISDKPIRASTSLAFFALALADLITKVAGFNRLHQAVKRWPLSKKLKIDSETVTAVCASVDRAGMFYPKHALCLQRSAVMTCLLRRKGVPAEMVIGCRKIPFRGHAWVEVNGQVVNDNAKVQTFYRVLERC